MEGQASADAALLAPERVQQASVDAALLAPVRVQQASWAAADTWWEDPGFQPQEELSTVTEVHRARRVDAA